VVAPHAEIVALAAWAGGLAALSEILGGLPTGFAAPILIVMHLDPRHRSLLADLLSRRTGLTVREAREGEPLQAGVVYVAPPDHHLRVTTDHAVRLTDTPPVHYARPSADELFHSVADAYGTAGVGVICTGCGTDGAEGLTAIRRRGGATIAQDEASSAHFGMPGEAIRQHATEYVLPLTDIAGKLQELVGPRGDGAAHAKHREP
jgi:two-component system, chemotaxis family, protein-glutamate methylesterase/glutaminase